MFIIFCNNCFESKEEHGDGKSTKFYCTSCSHVFCYTCIKNYENFCLICKAKCKVLEINENMPDSVKSFFDGIESVQKKIQEADKIYDFQYSQIEMYVRKNQEHKQKYYKSKAECMRLQKMDEDLNKAMKAEFVLMERLKNAYKTQNITEDLFVASPSLNSDPSNFSMKSRSINSSGASQIAGSSGYISSSSMMTFKSGSRSASPASSISTISQASGRPSLNHTGVSDDLRKMNVNSNRLANERIRQSQNSQRGSSQASNATNIFRETRQNLLENTLRQMQNATQVKYENYRRSLK